MTFIDMNAVSIRAPLIAAHYEFPRAEKLHEAFSWCVTDYYTKATLGQSFEANGLLVTGEPRVGKTKEVKQLVSEFNKKKVLMPDGRPASIKNCLLSKKETWKDLGVMVLRSLGYRLEARRTQSYIWELVHEQARGQGVIGIAFDECQHVFTEDGGTTNGNFIDSFKTLPKHEGWPLMLILSGVPDLAEYIWRWEKRKQLVHLLRPVHFDMIELPQDFDEMNRLAYQYAEKAELCFDPLSTVDFFERLDHSCDGRWGLVIELIIDAFVRSRLAGATEVSIDHFAEAYLKKTGLPAGFSPFTAPDYKDLFDRKELFNLLVRPR